MTLKEYLYYLRLAYPLCTDEERRRRAWKMHESQATIPRHYEIQVYNELHSARKRRKRGKPLDVSRRKVYATTEKFICNRCHKVLNPRIIQGCILSLHLCSNRSPNECNPKQNRKHCFRKANIGKSNDVHKKTNKTSPRGSKNPCERLRS